MKIDTGMASFYNASSRVHSTPEESRILKAAEAAAPQGHSGQDTPSGDKQAQQIPAKMMQTRISPDSSYQKNMVTDPRFAMERIASKLLDKVPDILNDMRKLPEAGSDGAVQSAEPSKIVIRENSAADYAADRQREMMQDITL